MRFLFVVLLVFNCTLSAQEYPFKQYDSTDGCPSSLVVGIEQDSLGYLYVGFQDKGIYKFDGYNFKNISNSLFNIGIIELYKDKKGCIWVGCEDGVFHIKGDSIVPITGLKDFYMRSFYETDQGVLYMGSEYGEIIKYSNGRILIVKQANGRRIGEIHGWGNEVLFIGDGSYVFKYEDDQISKISYSDKEEFSTPWSLCTDKRGDLLCSSLASIKYLKGGSFKNWPESNKLLKKFANHIYKDSRGRLWFLHLDAITVYDQGNVKYFPESNFKGLALVSVYEDFGSNIWLGTTKGLIRIKNENCVLNLLNLKAEFLIKSIFQDSKNRIWTGSEMDGLVYWKDNKTIKVSLPYNNVIIYCFYEDENSNIFIGTSCGIFIFKNNAIKQECVKCSGFDDAVYSITKLNNEIWASSKCGFIKISSQKTTFYHVKDVYENIDSSRSLCFIKKDTEGRLWFMSNNGIALYNEGSINELKLNNHAFKHFYFGMEEVGDGVFWFGTEEKGLLQINLKRKQYKYVNKINGRELNKIVSLSKDRAGNLFCGTHKGILKIKLDSEGNIFNTLIYNKSNGLIDEQCEYKQLEIDEKGNVWYGSGVGLVRFNATSTYSRSKILPTNLHFEHNSTNNKFQFNKSITIEASAILYLSSTDVRYSYFLQGRDESWSKPTKKRVNYFKGLDPGDYVLKVRTSVVGNNELCGESEIKFTVVKPYWRNRWFVTIVLLIFAFLIFSVIYLMQYLQKRKQISREKIKRKEIEVELRFLKSQMNPHFIFNSINSIQGLILEEEVDKSLNYLNDFGRMIRRLLNYCEMDTITIKEEVEFLKEYISLEKLRFKEKVNVNIIVDEKLDIEFDRIPPMLIQPFVENSIKHGLLPKKGNGELSIQFACVDDCFECTIQDDGVGRNYHRQAKQYYNHNSKGIQLINDRVQMLKQKADVEKNYMLVTEDLIDSNKNAIGTKVVFRMPIV